MKTTSKFWRQIISENIPYKYRCNLLQVSLRNKDEDWSGFDFSPKDLPLFYNNQFFLCLHLYRRNKYHEFELDDIKWIELSKYFNI